MEKDLRKKRISFDIRSGEILLWTFVAVMFASVWWTTLFNISAVTCS